jgi:cytochrome c peroxidase
MHRIQFMLVASVLAACTDPGATTDETSADVRRSPQVKAGERLFDNETFHGNGRTCATCHAGKNETLSPEDIVRLARHGRHDDPIFRSIDADVVGGNTYDRLLTNATIRINIPLPDNVAIQGSTARSAELFRGIPSTLNAPALQPVLMADGRAPNLQAQAAGAIAAHMEPGTTPTQDQLDDIAAYEQTQFSSAQLESFAAGGPEPVLPPGRTDSEKRGRIFFTDDAHSLVPRCVHCHSGPMLDTTSPGLQDIFGVPAGSKVFTAFVSQLQTGGGTPVTYEFTDASGNVTTYTSTDPGRALISGNPAEADMFKITTLWNAKNTAPYFHNNGAKNLDELMDHYQNMFGLFGLSLSTQDRADIIAYLKLL